MLALVFGVASAQDAAKTWDFQSDKVDEAPSGFSFGKTGQGRPGKWIVRVDPSAPAGDHVLAQVDADDTDYRFPVAVADAPDDQPGGHRPARSKGVFLCAASLRPPTLGPVPSPA